MLEVSVSYNRFKYLGNEFLTWVWFLIEKDPRGLARLVPADFSLNVGNRVVLENRSEAGTETVTIKGDSAGMEEGMLALRKGALVAELNLAYESADKRWSFTLKGESLNISNLKTPETGPVETGEDLEGLILEKAYLFDVVHALLDDLFRGFIKLRTSNRWQQEAILSVQGWILSFAP